MQKDLKGSAVVNYGKELPPSVTSYNGALFYKTSADGKGLYISSLSDDPNSGVTWNTVGGADSGISVSGPTTVIAGTTNTYQITDYDTFSTYTVTTDIGAASQLNDVITVTTPIGASGAQKLFVNVNGVIRTLNITITASGVVTPVITYPANDAVNIPTSFNLRGSAFSTMPVGISTHASTVAQVALDASFSNIVEQITVSTGDLTVVPVTGLLRNTQYFLRLRYIAANTNSSAYSSTVNVKIGAEAIMTPTLTTETVVNAGGSPLFTGSLFSPIPAGSDSQVSSNWVLRLASDSSVVWQSINDTVNLTSIVVPWGTLSTSTSYTMEVQYNGGFSSSMFSDRLTFATAAEFTPTPGTDAGKPFSGGYYAGANIWAGGVEYALVVAPKSLGGESNIGLEINDGTNVAGAVSTSDGWVNTAAIQAMQLTSPATAFCRNLSIGGFTDWYLPSKDELEICYRYFKPNTFLNYNSAVNGINNNSSPAGNAYTTINPLMTTAILFANGTESFQVRNYWSSTQVDGNPPYNWLQTFQNGAQGSTTKTGAIEVRAVRRVQVSPSNEVPGFPRDGGFYAGKIKQYDGNLYAIIVSPRGTELSAPFGPGRQPQGGNTSDQDGWLNTQLMVADTGTWPAAEYCRGLTTNGYSDWYMPAKNELEICYRYLKPTTDSNSTDSGANPDSIPIGVNYTSTNPTQTTAAVFKPSNGEAFASQIYWSSTVDASNPTAGWMQVFNNGFRAAYGQTGHQNIRPIRRQLIRPLTPYEMLPGTPYKGGYFAGLINQADGVYSIIVAPKSVQLNSLGFGPGRQPQGGNTSDRDGLMNTQLMVADTGSWPAAEYCDGLTANGYSDWYMPAKNELEILYRNLKPTTDANSTSYGANPDSVPPGSNYTSGAPAQTANTAFKIGAAEAFNSAYYWSSSVNASSPTGAWNQFFGSGYQGYNGQSSDYSVRPVRRELVRAFTPFEMAPGTPYQGGYFAGLIQQDDGIYAIVVSPKSAESTQMLGNGSQLLTAISRRDGWTNSSLMFAMGAAAWPAAGYCRALNINGYNDWYLPATDELEICYRKLKPTTAYNSVGTGAGSNPNAIPPTSIYTATDPLQTTNSNFMSPTGTESMDSNIGYWSSTPDSDPGREYNGQAQNFNAGNNSGIQSTALQTTQYSVRPIRRVKVG